MYWGVLAGFVSGVCQCAVCRRVVLGGENARPLSRLLCLQSEVVAPSTPSRRFEVKHAVKAVGSEGADQKERPKHIGLVQLNSGFQRVM